MGIRLDSGDLAYLSIQARRILDEAGFPNASIAASNELDEYLIAFRALGQYIRICASYPPKDRPTSILLRKSANERHPKFMTRNATRSPHVH